MQSQLDLLRRSSLDLGQCSRTDNNSFCLKEQPSAAAVGLWACMSWNGPGSIAKVDDTMDLHMSIEEGVYLPTRQ